MKLRSLRTTRTPKLMIIPMIDIIFFLLVFFMMSMLSMVVQKSMPVSLPAAQSSKIDLDRKVPITITKDGTLYVEDKVVPIDVLVRKLQVEQKKGDHLTIIIRADKDVPYGQFVTVMDTIKKVGISRISIATEQ